MRSETWSIDSALRVVLPITFHFGQNLLYFFVLIIDYFMLFHYSFAHSRSALAQATSHNDDEDYQNQDDNYDC